MMRKNLFLILGTLLIASCDKNLPSGFWKEYRSELIEERDSHQRPYGGSLTIFWSSSENDAFSEIDVLEFAIANEWEPVDSITFTHQDMQNWSHHDSTPVFPVYFNGTHKMYSENDLSGYTAFDRWIESDLTVYRCRTKGHLRYPGTDESTRENGYILISKDGKQMTVYNIWGE
tara:strand:- start:3994 stop:4515 length:522 start_codon:yes stop_codon:yes gene_type:complete